MKNPFTLENCALDAFFLSQCEPHAERKSVSVWDLAAEMVKLVKNIQSSYALETGESKRFVLGLSESKETWDEDLNTWTSNKKVILFRNSLAFTPSILSICVGISVVIVLSNFVFQLSWAIENINVINDFVRIIKMMNFFVQGMANVASCIDPAQLKMIQTVGLSACIKQLTNWPPISSEILRMSHDLNISTNLSAGEFEMIKQYLLLPTLSNIVSNNTQILYDLPLFGSTIQCFSWFLSSDEYKVFFDPPDASNNSDIAIFQRQTVNQSQDICRSYLKMIFL